MAEQTVQAICARCNPPAGGALRRGAVVLPVGMAHPGARDGLLSPADGSSMALRRYLRTGTHKRIAAFE
jgi:hypothetical protein